MPGMKRLGSAVRPRAEDLIDQDDAVEGSDDFEEFEDEGSSPSLLDTGDGGDVVSSEGNDSGEEGADATPDNARDQLKNVSFGTLARAQDSLSRKRKRNSDTNADQEQKLDTLRARLQEIKQAKLASNDKSGKKSKADKSSKKTSTTSKTSTKAPKTGPDEEEDSASASGDDSDAPKARSSKHAPTSQSSKYQVTRRREVVDVPKRHVRDPRFGPSAPGSLPQDPNRTEAAYAFLHDYEDSEMKDLRRAIKTTKSEEDKETLRRKLMSMENRKKSRVNKERERDVVRAHRREERGKVQDGKNPFYMKKADVKKGAQKKKLEGMKKGEIRKMEEKKKRKEGQKEKKSMPAPRRVAG